MWMCGYQYLVVFIEYLTMNEKVIKNNTINYINNLGGIYILWFLNLIVNKYYYDKIHY